MPLTPLLASQIHFLIEKNRLFVAPNFSGPVDPLVRWHNGSRPMRSRLAQRLSATLQRDRMITPGDRVGVAVSGGADSVALLRLLCEIRDSLGISLVVLHFDHQLRPDSPSDARFV